MKCPTLKSDCLVGWLVGFCSVSWGEENESPHDPNGIQAGMSTIVFA